MAPGATSRVSGFGGDPSDVLALVKRATWLGRSAWRGPVTRASLQAGSCPIESAPADYMSAPVSPVHSASLAHRRRRILWTTQPLLWPTVHAGRLRCDR